MDKLLFRVQAALAVPMELSSVERYSEDSALYECSFTTALPEAGGDAWVTEAVLAQAGRLAMFWNIGAVGPGDDFWGHSNGGVGISGVEEHFVRA